MCALQLLWLSESKLCLTYRVSEFTSGNVSRVAGDNVPSRVKGRALTRVQRQSFCPESEGKVLRKELYG